MPPGTTRDVATTLRVAVEGAVAVRHRCRPLAQVAAWNAANDGRSAPGRSRTEQCEADAEPHNPRGHPGSLQSCSSSSSYDRSLRSSSSRSPPVAVVAVVAVLPRPLPAACSRVAPDRARRGPGPTAVRRPARDHRSTCPRTVPLVSSVSPSAAGPGTGRLANDAFAWTASAIARAICAALSPGVVKIWTTTPSIVIDTV